MNQKKILRGISITAITAILLGWASMTSAVAEPATVGMGTNECGMFDQNGEFIAADRWQSVATNNAKNTGKITCHVFGIPNTTGAEIVFEGFLCNTGSDITTDSRQVISYDEDTQTGNATLFCKNDV